MKLFKNVRIIMTYTLLLRKFGIFEHKSLHHINFFVQLAIQKNIIYVKKIKYFLKIKAK